MSDEQVEADFEVVKKFKNLSTSFRHGWSKLVPVSEKRIAFFREALKDEWQKNQSQREGQSDSKGKSLGQAHDKNQQQKQKQEEQ